MWNTWTIPRIKVGAYIALAYVNEDGPVYIWEGKGRLAFVNERTCWEMKVGDVFIKNNLTLRIVSYAEAFPSFGYLVMRESFEARCYQVLLPLLGIIQSVFYRILWTAVIWDLVYVEPACEARWRDFRPIRRFRRKRPDANS